MKASTVLAAAILGLFAFTGSAQAVAPPCTLVLGFSQTRDWFPYFEQNLPNQSQYQAVAISGQDIDDWGYWYSTGWKAWRDNSVTSKCTSSQRTPQRVILTISGEEGSNVGAWTSKIQQAVKTIRGKFTYGPQIVLQAVVGGPSHGLCYVSGARVRASYQHPYIDQAIANVVAADPSVLTGYSPEVDSCSQYRDEKGHLYTSGSSAVGAKIAAYYGAQ